MGERTVDYEFHTQVIDVGGFATDKVSIALTVRKIITEEHSVAQKFVTRVEALNAGPNMAQDWIREQMAKYLAEENAGVNGSPAGDSGQAGQREDPVRGSGDREVGDSSSVLPEEGITP